jgi:hypothetical protein
MHIPPPAIPVVNVMHDSLLNQRACAVASGLKNEHKGADPQALARYDRGEHNKASDEVVWNENSPEVRDGSRVIIVRFMPHDEPESYFAVMTVSDIWPRGD